MSSNVINVYKKCGQTPLDCINEIKKANTELTHLPLTYAGRLDPLAEGVLLILVGEECLKKDHYLALSKEYELTILFGFETDTYDLMGKIKEVSLSSCQFSGPWRREDEDPDHETWYEDFALKIQKILPKFTGRIVQAYPPYSSRTVNGKPLFQWAREGRLNEIAIPSHEVFVNEIEIIKNDFILVSDLLNKIKNDIGLVKGDFRQEEIISIWKEKLKDLLESRCQTVTLRVSCGSGVYVRSIANDLGKELGIPALALNIKRIKVGEYIIE